MTDGAPQSPVRVLLSRTEGVPGLYDLLILKDWQPDDELRDLDLIEQNRCRTCVHV